MPRDNSNKYRNSLLACFQTEAEYACFSFMTKITINSAVIIAWGKFNSEEKQ
jgi:hypothetical protein